MRLRVAFCAAFFALYAGAASAQARVPPQARLTAPVQTEDRLRVMLDVGAQATSVSFDSTTTFQQYFEQGSARVERKIPKQVFFGGGVAVRVVGRLYAGVNVSSFTSNGSGTVAAQVPNPLFFNQPRSVTGTVSGVDRRETAAHVQAIWTEEMTKNIDWSVFAGPSIIQTEQVFVTNANVSLGDETYPFDTLQFSALKLTTGRDKENVIGYNVGTDITWRFFTTRPRNPRARSRSVGLGLLLRYTHGTKNFNPAGGQITKLEVGGLQAGGGLRFIF